MTDTTRLSRAEQRDRTRIRLLEAAAAAFAEHGVDGAAIDDIAARAGFTRGAFYSNFADKTELLIALCDHRLAAFATEQLPVLLAAPPETQLATVARWLTAEQPPLEVLLVVELARQRTTRPEQAVAVGAAIDRVLDTLGRLLTPSGTGLPAGPDTPPPATAASHPPELPAEEREARARAVLAAVLGADLLRHLGVGPDPRTMELLLAGIGDPEVTR